MDYTDLNDACPKDSFPLPRIDQIVDASAGHGMLSFLDAFSRYHKIPIHPPDAEKNVFHYSPWTLLLQRDAFRLKERRSKLSEVGNENVSAITWQHDGSLH